MGRVMNHDVALVKFANEVVGSDFEWGETDCAMIAVRSQAIMLGKNPFAKHVGKWSTKTGALRVFKGLDIKQALQDSGGVRVSQDHSTTGDVILGPTEDVLGLPQLAVVVPVDRVLISTPEDGVMVALKSELIEGTEFWRYE